MPQSIRMQRAAQRRAIRARRFAPLAFVACAALAPAQETQPAAPAVPLAPLVDRAYGFELLVPAGWTYDRTPFPGPGNSRGLLRGVSLNGESVAQVLLFRGKAADALPVFVEYFVREIRSIDGTSEIRTEPAECAPAGAPRSQPAASDAEPAAYIDVVARLKQSTTRTVYFARPYDERSTLVVSLGGVLDPTGDGADGAATPIPETFRQMTASLHVSVTPTLAAELKASLERGRDFVRAGKLLGGIPRLQIDDALRFYQIEREGHPVGYMTRRFTREEEPGTGGGKARRREGLRVREVSWRFDAGGQASESTLNVFATLDGKAELCEQVVTNVPLANAPNPLPVTARVQVLRESDSIVATVTADVAGPSRTPSRTLTADQTYVSAAWLRVLPALAGAAPAEPLGFTILDPDAQTLIVHTVRPLGERPLPIGGSVGKAYELRDGLSAGVGTLFTDEFGHWLRYEAGAIVIRTIGADEIERNFAAARKAALVRMGAVPADKP